MALYEKAPPRPCPELRTKDGLCNPACFGYVPPVAAKDSEDGEDHEAECEYVNERIARGELWANLSGIIAHLPVIVPVMMAGGEQGGGRPSGN